MERYGNGPWGLFQYWEEDGATFLSNNHPFKFVEWDR